MTHKHKKTEAVLYILTIIPLSAFLAEKFGGWGIALAPLAAVVCSNLTCWFAQNIHD